MGVFVNGSWVHIYLLYVWMFLLVITWYFLHDIVLVYTKLDVCTYNGHAGFVSKWNPSTVWTILHTESSQKSALYYWGILSCQIHVFKPFAVRFSCLNWCVRIVIVIKISCRFWISTDRLLYRPPPTGTDRLPCSSSPRPLSVCSTQHSDFRRMLLSSTFPSIATTGGSRYETRTTTYLIIHTHLFVCCKYTATVTGRT